MQCMTWKMSVCVSKGGVGPKDSSDSLFSSRQVQNMMTVTRTEQN